MEGVRQRIRNVSYSGIVYVRRLEDGETVPNSAKWKMSGERGQNGKELVDGYAHDVWDVSWFVGHVPKEVIQRFSPDDDLLETTIEVMLEARGAVRRLDDEAALKVALSDVKAAMNNCYANETSKGRPLEPTLSLMTAQGAEALDRSYGQARIRLAGIDLGKHPEFRSYQAFYDRGMAPPTHQEMADCIIGLLGKPAE